MHFVDIAAVFPYAGGRRDNPAFGDHVARVRELIGARP